MSIDDNNDFDKRFGPIVSTIPTERRWAVLLVDRTPRSVRVEAIVLTTRRILLLVNYKGRLQYLPQDHADFLGIVESTSSPSDRIIDRLTEFHRMRGEVEAV